MNIPAVRGLGGSLLYFVDHKSGLDRLWDIDFETVAGDLGADAGLTRSTTYRSRCSMRRC